LENANDGSRLLLLPDTPGPDSLRSHTFSEYSRQYRTANLITAV